MSSNPSDSYVVGGARQSSRRPPRVRRVRPTIVTASFAAPTTIHWVRKRFRNSRGRPPEEAFHVEATARETPGRTDVARRIARRVSRSSERAWRRCVAREPPPPSSRPRALALSFVRTEAQEVRDPLSSLSALLASAQGASASFDSSVDCAARIAWTPEDVAVDEVLVPCGLAVAGDAVPTEARDESCAACLVGVGGVLLPRMRTAGLDPNDPAHVTSCVTAALPSAARAGVRVGELLFACERVAAAALRARFPKPPTDSRRRPGVPRATSVRH